MLRNAKLLMPEEVEIMLSNYYLDRLSNEERIESAAYEQHGCTCKAYVDIKNKSEISTEILQPLYDDLNTPGYIANLHQLYEKAQKGNEQDKSLFVAACQFVGLLCENKENWLKFKTKKALISEKEILQKIQERNKARNNKKYEEADKIRNELLDKGVLIEDKDGKTTWKFK